MRDVALAKVATNVAPFLDAGEEVRDAAPAFEGPRIAILFGLLGWLMLDPFILVVTEQHIYLFRAGRFSALSPKSTVEKHRIADVTLDFERAFPFDRFTLTSQQRQTTRILWVAKRYGEDVVAAVAAKS